MTPSPCIRLCEMDEQRGYCRGCYRTLPEIMKWRESSDKQRKAILREVAKRRSSDASAGTYQVIRPTE